MKTPIREGSYTRKINGEPKTVDIFVAWLDNPMMPVSQQLPNWMTCPGCGSVIDLSPVRGNQAFSNPVLATVPYACKTCSVMIVFDRTPFDMREQLMWLQKLRNHKPTDQAAQGAAHGQA
jgi:hypothetical protein